MLAGQLQEARERLINSYAGLTDEEMLEPGVAGDWSIRDILAHVAAWDRAQTEAYRMMLRGERPALLDLDEEANEAFNHEHHERLKDLDRRDGGSDGRDGPPRDPRETSLPARDNGG